jgi:ATP sulfurylase/adenylyl-sulfate kinase
MAGFVVWLTGLSGAGKSTIAGRLSEELAARGRTPEILDGDEVRTNLSKGLGFSKEDRDTNIRRIGYVARLLARNGAAVITAAISPYRDVRDEIRAQTPGFVEVYVRCSLEELVRRDVKGLYRKALAGELSNFTGVNDPYEPPAHPEVVVDSEEESVEDSVDRVLEALVRLGHLPGPPPDRVPRGQELEAALEEARHLPGLEVGSREHSDLYLLASRGLAPLDGFMGELDYQAVVADGRLADGSPFTIPVTLRIEDGRSLPDRMVLRREGEPIGILDVESTFLTQPEFEAEGVYGTASDEHPGVRLLRSLPARAVAGKVTALQAPSFGFPAQELSPRQVRRMAAERGWRTMVGFQTRNPVHRAHEYLQKVALELVDGLLLHPLVGETKSDDIPVEVRMACYEALLSSYYPADRVLLATNPAWMRYAGPAEAVFHAILRRNYGCTHFIVGRDHAGVGTFYDTYAAHRIFDRYRPGELGIEILRFENSFYCRTCGGMASTRTCPHPAEDRASLSGTRVRELLAEGEPLPPEFTRPEVAEVLRRALVKA